MSDFSPNPEELCTKSEREVTLRDAIAKLRPCARKALEIHKLQERSLEETATVLGISVKAVKARVFHARAAPEANRAIVHGKSMDSSPLFVSVSKDPIVQNHPKQHGGE